MSEVLRQDNPAADGSAARMQSDSGPSHPHNGNRSGGAVQPTTRICPMSGVISGYACVFVCLVTRAVHLEVVLDLTTDAFIAVLKAGSQYTKRDALRRLKSHSTRSAPRCVALFSSQ